MGATMNEDRYGVVTFTIYPASVAAATSAEQTVTVNGLKVGDVVALTKPTLTAGVGIVNVRVSAANTLAVTFMNATASSVDPASETYTLCWFRPEKTVSGVVNP
jgi:hypothetical protein